MRQRQIPAGLAAVILLLVTTAPAVASLCDFDSIAIFAFNSAHVSRDADVTGDVVANSESPGPVLDEGAEVALDRGSKVTGDVSAHTIDLDKQSTIDGDANYVELTNQGTITGAQNGGSPPPYTDVPDFQSGGAGGDDVFAGAGQTVTLGDEGFCSVATAVECTVDTDCPGFALGETCERSPVTAYRDVVLGGGTVLFTGGGSFDVRSISGTGAVEFDAPTDLRVAARIDTEAGSSIGPAASSSITAADIVIYVAGTNGGAGGPLDEPFAVNLGQAGIYEANIYAPNGTIDIDKNSTATGAFLGRDVKVNRAVVVTVDSAFTNDPPIALAQEVLTDGANDLLITLEGADPEGADLTFSIEVPPAGSLGPITPITPAAVQLCSQSGAACSTDPDCPGFAEGETCDTVQPPVTQATVTYTPTGCSTTFSCSASTEITCTSDGDCPSGETCSLEGGTECAPDSFTFGVTDDCGALGTAVVGINGDTGEVPDDPGGGVTEVEADDATVDTVVNGVRTITLTAAAPATVGSLTFRVETLPSGALEDSNGTAITSAPVDLPSPVLTYQAPATTGADSFTFSARDSTTSPTPCVTPSCDTGTVNIDVGDLPELAPDLSVGTDLNQPVEITLGVNPGGGSSFAAAPAGRARKLTYGNGELTADQISRARAIATGSRGGSNASRPVQRLTNLGIDQGWFQFSWCDVATSPGCNDLVDLVNETEVNESPFDFTTSEDSCLRVTDALAKGDHWRVENLIGGNVDWTDFTSEVPQSTVGTTSDPDVAFGDLSYSHGAFDLAAGVYSIRLTTIPPDSFAFGTAGYIRIDTGPCVDIVWTVTSLPANGTLTNLDGSLVQIGDTYTVKPTVVFTPTFNFTGSTSFGYSVTEGGTIGPGVTDTAIVDILISANDPCILVGREPGCAPGGGSFSEGGGGSAGAGGSNAGDLEPEVRGPALYVEIDGPGSVTSSGHQVGARILRLSCGAGTCARKFEDGTEVTLMARPDDEARFVGWSGDCFGEDQITQIWISGGASCTAIFERTDP